MQQIRRWVKSWRGVCLGVAASLLWLTAAGFAQANMGPQGKEKDQKKPDISQQLCPANGGTCSVNSPCPASPAKELKKTKTPDNKPAPAPKKQP
jgi:hypothetical protein